MVTTTRHTSTPPGSAGTPVRVATPGPSGGEAIRMLPQLQRDPLGTFAALAHRYGDVFRLPLPNAARQVLVVARPELVTRVLVSNQDNYVKAQTYVPLTEILGNGLLTNEGDHWFAQRRIVQPMFARRHIDSFGSDMVGAATRKLDEWDRRPSGRTVDAAAEMSALTLDIVGRTLFSTDLTGEAAAMGPALERVLHAFERTVRHPLFLLARNYHRWPTPTRLRSRSSENHLRHVVDGLIAERQRARHDGQRDLLDMLLAARDADSGAPMPEQQVRDELMTFMLAGHETTAMALSWTLMQLSQHPAARERLEAEVDDVLGDALPQAGDIDRLPWTTAVLSESMRLYPPAWMLERTALGPDDLGGHAVPAGSIVATPPYLIHRHEQHWPNPEGFDPHRFLPDAAADRHRLAYLPFGGGRRQCVGSGFAMLEATLVLATIVQRYRATLVGGFRPQMNPTVTLRPMTGIPMALHRR